VARTHQLTRRLEAGLPPNPLVTSLRAGVSDWQALLPAVAALRNPDLRERHWAAVGDVLGMTMDKREGMSLADVLQLGVGGCVSGVVGGSGWGTEGAWGLGWGLLGVARQLSDPAEE